MTTSSTMSRKRPSPGSSNGPVQIASASPTTNGGGMSTGGYLNTPTTVSAALNGNGISATASPYGHHLNGVNGSPTTQAEVPDIYNLTNGNRLAATNNATNALNMAISDNNQVVRIANRNSSLMRLPQNQSQYYGPNNNANNINGEQYPQIPVGIGTALGSGGPNSTVNGGVNGLAGLEMYGDLAPLIRKAKGKKPNIPPFVQKLSQFVNDPKCDHLIRWSPSGTSFLVLDEDEFSKTLIPDLFKHNNYASFVRQLNMYGFHKVVGLADGSLKTSEQRSKPPSEYKNQYFIRGMPELMWLIQKPKNTAKRRKGGKKGKAEDSDEEGNSDNEANSSGLSHDDVHLQPAGGGGYIEAPPSNQLHHSNSKPDLAQIAMQLEQVKQHQAVISNAINRLRKDNNQLYEQSIAFQTLHDRHETSISAILTFLATVYDKSLAGHISSQTIANLFQGAVDANPNSGQVIGNQNTPGNMGVSRAGVVGGPNGTQRMPFKRKPLMLPPAPNSSTSSPESLKGQNVTSQSQQQQHQPQTTQAGPFGTYQSPSIQEVFTPAPGQLSPGQSPTLSHSHLNSGFFPNLFSMSGPNDQHNGLNGRNQNQLTPRLLQRAITPLLQAAEQHNALQQHQNKVVENRSVLEQVKIMQDQQNESINRLMEIVGPYTTTDTSTSPTAPPRITSPIKAARNPIIPNATATPAAIAPVAAASSSSATTTVAADGVAAADDGAPANLAVALDNQTPSPATNGNFPSVSGPPSDPSSEFVDIDQFLDSDWLPESMDQYTQQPNATDDTRVTAGGDVNLDPTLFLDETAGYSNGGYGIVGGMGGITGMMSDGTGQILGTNPSTAVGSPSSPGSFEGLENLSVSDDVSGGAKKKRRTG